MSETRARAQSPGPQLRGIETLQVVDLPDDLARLEALTIEAAT